MVAVFIEATDENSSNCSDQGNQNSPKNMKNRWWHKVSLVITAYCLYQGLLEKLNAYLVLKNTYTKIERVYLLSNIMFYMHNINDPLVNLLTFGW